MSSVQRRSVIPTLWSGRHIVPNAKRYPMQSESIPILTTLRRSCVVISFRRRLESESAASCRRGHEAWDMAGVIMSKKTWEICPSCGRSLPINSGRIGLCDNCGCSILPCNSCEADCSSCPYQKKIKGCVRPESHAKTQKVSV